MSAPEYLHPNSYEECSDWVRKTLEILDDNDVPEDLRNTAFQVVSGWLATKVAKQQIPRGLMALPGHPGL